MAKELKTVSNGIFTLAETGVENHFYFYRNDMEVVGDVGCIPLELYKQYVVEKIMRGEMDEKIESSISFQTSEDGSFLRIIVSCSEIKVQKKQEKKVNFFKRIFGRNR